MMSGAASKRTAMVQVVWGLLGALGVVGATGCRDVQNTGVPPNTPRPDAGEVETRTCVTTVDCGGTGVCVAGLCQAVSSCTNDNDCAGEGRVCHQQRFFCVQCDGRSSQCPTGQTCQFDFTCVDIAGGRDAGTSACSGSCTDRTQCSDEQVCRMGECCPPPNRCTSPTDCPMSTPECNGATGQCFGGDGCFDDTECETRPGCSVGACFCQIGAGGPPGVCRVRANECNTDMDCWENGAYAGKFCTLQNPPRRCVNAPGCTRDADCAAAGLVCDTTAGSPSQNKCVNGQTCSTAANCGAGQACVNNVCVAQNCQNTPSLCAANETCDPVMLTCVPNQGGMCTTDTNCQAGYWCNAGTCQVGCRDNSECPGGVCNAAHMCEFAQGGVCGTCVTDNDCPAGARCVDNPFLGMSKCYEQCSGILNIPCTINPAASCIFGNCSCL